jgi:hypothetical protein
MIAIILKLKERQKAIGATTGSSKGLSSKLPKTIKAPPAPKSSLFKKATVSFGDKNIPMRISSKIKAKDAKDFWSPQKIKEYLDFAPEKHRKEMNIRGITVLNNAEFTQLTGAALLRSSSPQGIAMTTASLRQAKKANIEVGGRARIMGLHQNGRILINADGFDDVQKPMMPVLTKEYGEQAAKEWKAERARNTFLHEVGHHFDGKKSVFYAPDLEGKGSLDRVVSMYPKSQNPKALKELTGTNEFADDMTEAQHRIVSAEGFAELYAQYAQDAQTLKEINPAGFEFMKKLF